MEAEDVEVELQDAGDALGIVAPDVGTSKGKAYEVWVMLEIAARLQRVGADVWPRDRNGVMEPVFRVAGSPSDMPDGNPPGGGGPCHFWISDGSGEVELHLGLNDAGASGATHEIDLAVVPAHRAIALRSAGGGPYEGPVAVGVELKAYSDTHKLSHAIPRALLGVALDVDPFWSISAFGIVAGSGGLHLAARGRRASYFVVTSTSFFASSTALLSHHGVGALSDVLPTGAQHLIDDIVLAVMDSF